jgi:hypothetical protein
VAEKKASKFAYYLLHRKETMARAAANRTKLSYENYLRRIKKTYGLSPEQYANMRSGQKDLCAICGKPETALGRGGDIRRLHVDHDHFNERVRGLLCSRCNSAIGYFFESPKLLKRAAAYLERSWC